MKSRTLLWIKEEIKKGAAADITDRSKTDTHHEADILDFPNAHVNALPLIHRETDVDEVVFVGHAADLHEGKEVTVVVTAFRLQRLAKGHRAGR